MRTAFSEAQLADAHIKEAEHALRTCVHCGFCTASCPTYVLLGDERDSPRGRITLIQHMLESSAPPSAETVLHLDRCLSCLGCKSACPSGVDYSSLIDTARLHIAKRFERPLGERVFRSFVLFVLMRPKLFAFASALARVFAPVLPGKLGLMAKKAARKRPKARGPDTLQVPRRSPQVLLLKGCVQSALAPEIDLAAMRVLARQNIECRQVKGCCGALAYHLGREDIAKREARHVIAEFEQSNTESVLITATGCAAFLKDYGRVFAGDPEWATRAQGVAAHTKDFVELAEPNRQPARVARDLTIAFHPPCSLQHGQRISGRGEALLTATGFRLAALPDSHMCCGSAGSYSLTQPEIAEALRAKKLDAIRTTNADVIASANIGCLAHLAGETPTVHIAELLDWAAGGPKPF